jgi:serine/threonine protein kinase
VGDRIGSDLTVIGHLGVGHWSELYQVWSAERWCSLTCKLLSKEAAEKRTARAALRREHRILRRLHHPNIVRVFGGGEYEGLSFLLLDYLEGPSLLDVLEGLPDRRMPVADAIRTTIHAGAGLAHMHRSGFLHLDLKPANLLLREGVPVLLDMDTARPLNPKRAPRSSPGTAPYMSPEQAMRLPLDVRADVYGLGTILYELLTGRWPFESVYDGTEPRRGPEQKFPQVGDRPPPSPRSLRAEVTETLDEAVMRALARPSADRFRTVTEFLLALSAELEEPVSLWPKQAHPNLV